MHAKNKAKMLKLVRETGFSNIGKCDLPSYTDGCYPLFDLIFTGSRGYLTCKHSKSDIQVLLLHYFWES